MSMGDSVDNLHGISTQDIGNSKVNMTISEKHTLSNLTKNVYHFVQSICRPELLLICAAVAILLLIVRKCSFILLWGGSWCFEVLQPNERDSPVRKVLVAFLGGCNQCCLLSSNTASDQLA